MQASGRTTMNMREMERAQRILTNSDEARHPDSLENAHQRIDQLSDVITILMAQLKAVAVERAA
jgi:hypothetical protein